MASIVKRNSSYSVVYYYKVGDQRKTQWESYGSELEAMQRKAIIDYHQKNKDNEELLKLAIEYKQSKEHLNSPNSTHLDFDTKDKKKYGEFFEKWIPLYARKNKLQPNSHKILIQNVNKHILPYWEGRVISETSSEQIDDFIDYLSQKKCEGSKAYGKDTSEVPSLSSATIKKIVNAYYAAMRSAQQWGYIDIVPTVKTPVIVSKKRKFWTKEEALSNIEKIDDPIVKLAVHLSFICSLRPAETVGIAIKNIDLNKKTIYIDQTLQRAYSEQINSSKYDGIIKVFDCKTPNSQSQLILKYPKNNKERIVYLTEPLIRDIKQQLNTIENYKKIFTEDYNHYGLLICQPDGFPIEPYLMEKKFKRWQKRNNIENIIDMQGLRKSGQMYKIRVSGHDYQTVAALGGHSPEVLLNNYDEALEDEKIKIIDKLESDFYNKSPKSGQESSIVKLAAKLKEKPKLLEMLLKEISENDTTCI